MHFVQARLPDFPALDDIVQSLHDLLSWRISIKSTDVEMRSQCMSHMHFVQS